MNLDNNLELIDVSKMSRAEWLDARQEGLGGSDMSCILGLNKRFTRIELFYQKLGMNYNASEDHNIYTAWGTILEPVIRKTAEHLDLETDEWIDNWANGVKLRSVDEFNYMVRNPEYPWLLANLDGLINFDGQMADAIAEMKTISRQSADQWEGRMPIYYLAQVTMYMIVMQPMLREVNSHIYILEDGRDFWGMQVPKTQWLWDAVLEESHKFWELLEKGRDIIANTTNESDRSRFLAEIEPDPDDTPAYDEFASELHKRKSEFITVAGTPDMLKLATSYNGVNNEMKSLAKEKQSLTNQLKKIMNDHSANIIDFEDRGRITWNKKFYVNLK